MSINTKNKIKHFIFSNKYTQKASHSKCSHSTHDLIFNKKKNNQKVHQTMNTCKYTKKYRLVIEFIFVPIKTDKSNKQKYKAKLQMM